MATQLPADFEEYLAGPRIPDTTREFMRELIAHIENLGSSLWHAR